MIFFFKKKEYYFTFFIKKFYLDVQLMQFQIHFGYYGHDYPHLV
jgi:hypothetical protein